MKGLLSASWRVLRSAAGVAALLIYAILLVIVIDVLLNGARP